MRRLFAAVLLCAALGLAQPQDVADRVRQANRMMAAGRYAEAAKIYEEAVRALPDDPGLRTNLGMAYHLSGKDREAIEQFQAALKRQPGIVPALVMTGAAYLRLGRPDKALAPLREVSSAVPNLFEARQMLAEALVALGRQREAVPHYRRWTELAPRDPRAWYGLGQAYETLAGEAFDELKRVAPESAYMVALVAARQLRRRQYRSAYFLFREAQRREAGLFGLHQAVAEIYRATGHSDWAAKEEERARSLPPLDCNASPAACAFRDGRYERVVALTQSRKDPASLYWRARAYDKLAQQAFARLENLPPSAELHARRARLFEERKLYGDAIAEWKKALELAPGNPVFERNLAVAYRLNEDYAAARALAEKLLERDPESPDLNYLLGQVLLNQQQPEAAVPYLEKAVKKAPEFLPARSSLGLAYLQLQRDRDAVAHLEAALPIDADGRLRFRLARAYQRLGEPARAREFMKRYQEIRSRIEEERRSAQQELQITPP